MRGLRCSWPPAQQLSKLKHRRWESKQYPLARFWRRPNPPKPSEMVRPLRYCILNVNRRILRCWHWYQQFWFDQQLLKRRQQMWRKKQFFFDRPNLQSLRPCFARRWSIQRNFLGTFPSKWLRRSSSWCLRPNRQHWGWIIWLLTNHFRKLFWLRWFVRVCSLEWSWRLPFRPLVLHLLERRLWIRSFRA